MRLGHSGILQFGTLFVRCILQSLTHCVEEVTAFCCFGHTTLRN